MTRREPLTTPQATTWSVDDILRYARSGRLRIPYFQRDFRWEAKDIVNFFDSLYRGYPIGNLLIWETHHYDGTRPVFGSTGSIDQPGNILLVIDGQQRITSLVETLIGDQQNKKFTLYFDLKSSRFVRPGSGESENQPWLPMSKAANTVHFLEWLQERKLEPDLVTAANHLLRALRDYKIPVYTVDTGEESLVREIFKRLNTTGKALREADIFAALHRGESSGDLANVGDILEREGFGRPNETWLLKAFAATFNLDRSGSLTELFRKESEDERQSSYGRLTETFRRLIHFLRADANVPHLRLLPYRFPLVPLSRFFHEFPDPPASSRQILVKWLWLGASLSRHGHVSQPIVRTALDRIQPGDPEGSARRLLEDVSCQGNEFEMSVHSFQKAATKIACCALARLSPRNLVDGELVDVPTLLDERGADSFVSLTRRPYAGTENKLLHPACKEPLELIKTASPEILKSHAIERNVVGHLNDGDFERFLDCRRTFIENAVRTFLREKTDDGVGQG